MSEHMLKLKKKIGIISEKHSRNSSLSNQFASKSQIFDRRQKKQERGGSQENLDEPNSFNIGRNKE